MADAKTPELSFAWWKKNKPLTLTKTGLGDALREYGVAQVKGDDTKVLTALDAVAKAVATATQKANKTLHADILVGLGKMPKLIKDEKKKANDRIKKAAASGSGAPPKQKVGKDVVIWQRDIALEALKLYKPKWLQSFKGYELKLKLNDDILDVLEAEGDLVTPAAMVEDAQEIGAAAAREIADEARKIDAASKGKTLKEQKALRDGFAKDVKKILAAHAKKLEAVPAARWAKFVAKNKQYRDYKVKAGIEVTVGVLSFAGSVAATAGAAMTGGGLILAVVGMVRSIAGLAKQLHDLGIDAKKVAKDLKDDCDVLQARYQSAAKRAAAETGGTVLKGILGTDPPFLATIPKAKKNYKLWDNKVAGVIVACRKMSGDITKAMAGCDAAETQIRKLEGKKAQEAYKQLVKLRATLDKTLDACSTQMAQARDFEKNGPALLKVLEALDKENSDFNKIFDRVFPAVTRLTLVAAGAGTGFAGAESALQYTNTAVNLTKGVLSETKTQLEASLAS